MTDLQALKSFKKNIGCLAPLDQYINEVNFFEVTGITNLEIKHSNFLAWLFDANGSHKLGDAVIKRFLELVYEKNPDKIINIDYSTLDYSSFIVKREKEHLDIFLYSAKEKVTITIENKVWAKESESQTKKYREKIQKFYTDSIGYKNCFIFLTPDGIDANDKEYWCCASYKDIVNSIEKALTGNVKGDVKLIIDHYLEAVKRYILMSEINKAEQECYNIYKKHKQALDFLYANIPNTIKVTREFLLWFFNDTKNQATYKIVFDEKSMCDTTHIRFITEKMAKMIPATQKKYLWESNCPFLYEITVDSSWENLLLEGVGIDSTDKRIKKLYDISKKLDKTLIGKKLKKYEDGVRTFTGILYKENISKYFFEEIKEEIDNRLREILEKQISMYEEAVSREWKNEE